MNPTHALRRSLLSLTAAASLTLSAAVAHAQNVNPAAATASATEAPAAATRPAPSTTTNNTAAPADEVAISDLPADGTLVRRGRSETVIDAPFDVVVRTLTDFAHYSEFMPHVRESRVVRRNRSATDVYMQVPLGGSLGVIWALLRIDAHREGGRLELTGQAVDSNTDRFETRSVVERMPNDPNRTRVVFEVLALPRLPFPSSVFTREMRGAASTLAYNLRTRVARQLAINTLPANGTPEAVPPNATSSR